MNDSESDTSDAGAREWTNKNLQRLLAALKNDIEENDRLAVYTKGLKAVDWNKVAFPPFSPEECKATWTQILQKMRKLRTLTELIVEAEEVISDPSETKKRKVLPDFPKRPCPHNLMIYQEKHNKDAGKHPKMHNRKMLRALNKKNKKLRDEDQDEEHYESDAGVPTKPPTNGYQVFCKKQQTSFAGGFGRNFVKQTSAQQWRDLSENQREKYSKECRKLKDEYSVKLKEYLEDLDEEEQGRILIKHGIKRPREVNGDRKCKSFQGEPKLRLVTGYAIFFHDQMKLLKRESTNAKERITKILQRWKNLSVEEKELCKERSQAEVRKYSRELNNWFKKLTSDEQQDYLQQNPKKERLLDATQEKERSRIPSGRPSDSEDESIESSSSEEEEKSNTSEGEEPEEDEENECFEMF